MSSPRRILTLLAGLCLLPSLALSQPQEAVDVDPHERRSERVREGRRGTPERARTGTSQRGERELRKGERQLQKDVEELHRRRERLQRRIEAIKRARAKHAARAAAARAKAVERFRKAQKARSWPKDGGARRGRGAGRAGVEARSARRAARRAAPFAKKNARGGQAKRGARRGAPGVRGRGRR